MILINLLPYRAAARIRQRQIFVAALLLSTLMGTLLSAVMYIALHMKLSEQSIRNALLRTELLALQAPMRSVIALEQSIEGLRKRQSAVEELQLHRNIPVQLMNALAHQIPEGVVIREVKQDGLSVGIRGWAQSSWHVEQVMNKLALLSAQKIQPKLQEMVASHLDSAQGALSPGFNFSLVAYPFSDGNHQLIVGMTPPKSESP